MLRTIIFLFLISVTYSLFGQTNNGSFDKLIVGPRATIPSFSSAWIEGTQNPSLYFSRPGQAIDQKLWSVAVIADEFRIMTTKDDFSAISSPMIIKRGTGINVNSVSFPVGNIGIGTTAPKTDLEIYKYNGTSELRIHTNQHAGTALLEIAGGSALLDSNPDNYSGWSMYHSHNDTNKDLYFRHGKSGDPNVIFTDGGRIGVGTSSPKATMDITYDLRATPSNSTGLIVRNLGGGSLGQAEIKLIPAFPENHWSISANDERNLFRLFSGETHRMAIDGVSGNVGIGTTTPTEKLSVNGTIRSKEIICEVAPWPDYVFEDGYELQPLSELKTFIEEEGHLPGIPSADEVEENGVTLAKMNALLLEKIEELTLHVIRLEEQLEQLDK